jgi:hypothetical protein
VVVVAMSTMPGCASAIAAHCTSDRAYESGVNDARNGEDMNSSGYAVVCPAEQRSTVQSSYRAGYERGLASAPTVVVATAPAEGTCVEAYGKKACGYDCVEAYGTIKCGTEPDHNCVEAYGQIECGRNCRESYGAIECDVVSAVTGK